MKFFWKVFFTTLFISTICVTLSGYLLINSAFRTQLVSETNTALEYSEIVFYSLANQLEDVTPASFSQSGSSDDTAKNILAQVVKTINIDGINQRIAFCMIDEEQNTIFSSLDVSLDRSMISSINGTGTGGNLQRVEDHVYIQIIQPVVYLDHLFYIETVRDVTDVFTNHRAQYEMLVKILLGMLCFAGLLTFVLSKLLLRRIVALSEITKTFSGGNLTERVPARGQDEITLLSENFNHMADRLEETIHALKEEAEQKELFVGAFSHELKTPLTSIIGYSDLLLQKEMGAEQRSICIKYIFSEGKRLETLAMRLLDLIVLKKYSLLPQPVRIKDLLEKTVALAIPQLYEANIEIVCETDEAVIPMEAALMETVFINLIDNARKAIDRDGRILLSGKNRQDAYIVMIQDTGRGMDESELSKITDAFYMVDKSRSRKQGGAGLGLAICKEIIQLHGFDIQFESVKNVGTTVTITLKEQKK